MRCTGLFVSLLFLTLCGAAAAAEEADAARDILVTFDNRDAGAARAGVDAPYRNRKRYAIAASVRRSARAIENEYSLTRIDHWPIRTLSVYCYVFRVDDADDREAMIAALRSDRRVESVQALQSFEANASPAVAYDDTYAGLQHGLNSLDIATAHRYSTGAGIRVAVIDSDADTQHEDLEGRVSRVVSFTGSGRARDAEHGTAVASIIAAITNNSRGIVGVAPAAELELFVSCWQDQASRKAVCDSFTLAKALDALLKDPPDILNLSLSGPFDALLERLLDEVIDAGVVVVAAAAQEPAAENHFPASLHDVIGVGSSKVDASAHRQTDAIVYAPGTGILVALPENAYELRSGNSLAAAHVSGVVALLLADTPDIAPLDIAGILHESQAGPSTNVFSINACRVLRHADQSRDCGVVPGGVAHQKDSVMLNANRDSDRSAELTKGTGRLESW